MKSRFCSILPDMTSSNSLFSFIFILFYMHYGLSRNVVSTWSSGTGGSGLFGSLSFAALTTAGLSARKTVLLMLIIPVLLAVTFFLILDHEKRRVRTDVITDRLVIFFC